MGLENLKSIFSEDIGVNNSVHSGRHNNPDESYEQHGIIASQLNIDGTIPIFKTPFELGYGDYAGHSTDKPGEVNPSSFSSGIKFVDSLLPNMITLKTTGTGIFTTLNYINNATGQSLMIDSSINSMLGSVGISTQLSSSPTRYEDTVLEIATGFDGTTNPDGTTNVPLIPIDVGDDHLYPYRGIVFEVRDEKNLDNHPKMGGRTVFIKKRDPLLEPSMFENIFSGVSKLTGLEDIIDFKLPSVTITGGSGFDWGFNNFRPQIKIDAKALADKLKEMYNRIMSTNINIKLPVSFKLPDIGGMLKGVLSNLPDIDLGFTLPKINIPKLKGLKLLKLTKDMFGTITTSGGSLLINDVFSDFKSLINHPSYGEYGGVKDKRISPRSLINTEASTYISGELEENFIGPPKGHPAPGAGPYSRLHHARSDLSAWYSPKGNEGNYMLGSMDHGTQFVSGKKPDPAGDFMTLFPIKSGKDHLWEAMELFDYMPTATGKYGMPLYFQDLRDNSFILFRGYIDGITENLSPSWSSENYLGRSEPVYIYERSERIISFNLKLFAQTEDELDVLYTKKNKLTSLCYPEYKNDEGIGKDFSRMKPPLTKFRIGDLYGTDGNELAGFIDSLSYTVEDASSWEIKHGKQVPKLMSVAITYKVIHLQPPSNATPFYGFVGTTGA